MSLYEARGTIASEACPYKDCSVRLISSSLVYYRDIYSSSELFSSKHIRKRLLPTLLRQFNVIDPSSKDG